MTRRLLNSALGFCLGIFTLPVILVAWPFAAAWFMWNETDGDEE